MVEERIGRASQLHVNEIERSFSCVHDAAARPTQTLVFLERGVVNSWPPNDNVESHLISVATAGTVYHLHPAQAGGLTASLGGVGSHSFPIRAASPCTVAGLDHASLAFSD